MPQFNRMSFGKLANELGFVRDTFEKIYRLATILLFIQNDPLLSKYLALKGGTAINLTIFNLPRLSVDIDMDFIENLSRDDMLIVRNKITERIQKYMIADGYILSARSKYHHALDSFIFDYQNFGGVKDNIKIEINYMNRCHILPTLKRKVNFSWLDKELSVLTLHPLEIYASKVVALLNRAAARDLYDIYSMFEYNLFDEAEMPLLKKCAMFYYAISSDKLSLNFNFDNFLSISKKQIKTELIPVLRKGSWFDVEHTQEIVSKMLREILIPTKTELKFWSCFNNKEYCPELLFSDDEIIERLKNHPMAFWKCNKK